MESSSSPSPDVNANILDLSGAKGLLSHSPSHTPSDITNQHHDEDINEELSHTTSKKRSKSSHHQLDHSSEEILSKDQIDTYFANLRAECEELIDLVIDHRPLKHTYTEYSRNVELICRKSSSEQGKLATKIYDAVKKKYESMAVSLSDAMTITQVTQATQAKQVKRAIPIQDFVAVIGDWEKILRDLSVLFIYLDRSYLLPHSRKVTIRRYGVDLFANDKAIYDACVADFFDQLDQYRRNRSGCSNLPTLIEAGTLIRRFTITEFFQIQYYNQTDKYTRSIPIDGVYLKYILTELQLEVDFLIQCGFNPKFRAEVFENLRYKWIFRDFSLIINAHFSDIVFSEHLTKEFEILLDYIEVVDENYHNYRQQLSYHWQRYLDEKFENGLKNYASDRSTIINNLLDDYNSSKDVVKTKFRNWSIFESCIKGSLKRAINTSEYNLMIMSQLSKYCDTFLRNFYNNKKQEVSFQMFSSNVMNIFYCITNKGDFIALYTLDVSKRLLTFKDIDLHYEQELVAEFIKLIGENDETIIPLKKMLEDVVNSRQDYNEVRNGITFNCLVLEKINWPDVPRSHTSPIVLNSKLQAITDSVDSSKKVDHKILDWNYYNFHQLSVNYQFGTIEKELVVNLFQANVLLLFNDSESYDISQISALTDMPDTLVKRVLNSLSTDKYRILIQKGTTYHLNSSFNDKSQRVKIPYVRERDSSITKSTENQPLGSRDTVDSDGLSLIHEKRQYAYKSRLVGIMKRERKLKVVELFNLAIEVLERKGPVTIQDLKASLESLITGEFIKRVDRDYVEYIP